MPRKKKTSVDKTINKVIDYVEETLAFLKSIGKQTSPELVDLEKEMNVKFESLLPREQAHVLFFAIMCIAKLARLKSRDMKAFSNPVLVAQTFMSVMDASVSQMNMDMIDVAFAIEANPIYEMQDGDIEKILTELKKRNLSIIEPQGNA